MIFNAVAMIVVNLINANFLSDVKPANKVFAGSILLFISGVYLIFVALLDLSLFYVVTCVFGYMFALGLIRSNAIAGALNSNRELAGLISGVNGVLQFGLGAAASTIVSISSSQSAMAMNSVMFACAVFSLFSATFLYSKKHNQQVPA